MIGHPHVGRRPLLHWPTTGTTGGLAPLVQAATRSLTRLVANVEERTLRSQWGPDAEATVGRATGTRC